MIVEIFLDASVKTEEMYCGNIITDSFTWYWVKKGVFILNLYLLCSKFSFLFLVCCTKQYFSKAHLQIKLNIFFFEILNVYVAG